MNRELLEKLREARAQRQAVAVITELEGSTQTLIARGEEPSVKGLSEQVADAFRRDQSRTISLNDVEYFIHIHNPPLRMIVVGAVHMTQHLVPMAQATGYDVTIIDPRGAFATDERFPNVTLMAEWPDEVLPTLGIDHRACVLALTHDPKIDDPALSFALNSECFYIGALGSTRTHAARLERLKANGFDDEALACIHGPIGLNIGSRGPAEIAISILAEVTSVLRLGSAG